MQAYAKAHAEKTVYAGLPQKHINGVIHLYPCAYTSNHLTRTAIECTMEPPWENFAEWIWHPRFDDSRNPGSIVLFRREFEISEDATSVTINVSADSRYRLFLNGQSISVGPCKGTPLHWYYETVDATPFVRKGRNVLAAQVLRYSNNYRGNTSIMRASIPGFILLTKGTKVCYSIAVSYTHLTLPTTEE